MEKVTYIKEPFSYLERNEKVNTYALVLLEEELKRDEISCAEIERLCYLMVSNPNGSHIMGRRVFMDE